MSADQAFDNLMNRNAFAIPVAKTAGMPGRGTSQRRRSREGAGAGDRNEPRDAGPDDAAVRVSELFDNEAGDYTPRPIDDVDPGMDGMGDHPTETDLAAVMEEDGAADGMDLSTAHRAGARILGRDTDISHHEPDGGGYDDDPAGADAYADAGADDAADVTGAQLGRAKRVRRLAYLPLAGADAFDSAAREMMAGITAVNPERPSLAVTSAMRGEGRTELAIRLALALARRVGYRVLLADFDVRKPGVASRLGVSSKYFTLADVLRGSCAIGEALTLGEEDNLYILPARASDRDGDEILDSRQIQVLMTGLHRAFDFTIIDCGPANHADVMILCRQAGATALAGRCGVSSPAALTGAGERLETGGARIAGMLLTGA